MSIHTCTTTYDYFSGRHSLRCLDEKCMCDLVYQRSKLPFMYEWNFVLSSIYCKFELGPIDDNMFLGCLLTTGNLADAAARATASDQDGDIKRVSTKDWARSTGYDPVKLFNKVQVLLHT